MEELYLCKTLFSLLLLLFSLFQFSSAYTLPDKYFINCGSDSPTTINGRTFTGDVKSNSVSISGESSPVSDDNPSAETSILYQSARVFTKPSSYELQILENGTYMVRLHFYPFSSPNNLSNAHFNVLASGFYLLSNFTAQIGPNSPQIKEFLLTINVGKFVIYFTPSGTSDLAFVNAIEVFIVPESFISDFATYVTHSGIGSSFNNLPTKVLHTIHRINVGGLTITPDNDTLWRTWVPDDDYLLFHDSAKNIGPSSGRPNYQSGGSSDYTAPDLVYQTAKELNIRDVNNFFNMTWNFNVSKNAKHLVRFHFCDIIGDSVNLTEFNLYIYSMFSFKVNPYEKIPQLAAPFYFDFVVDSDDLGILNISIGPRPDWQNQIAFLNGLEILELKEDSGAGHVAKGSSKKGLVMIIGIVLGGLAFALVLMVVVFLGMKWRKAKPVETTHLPLVPFYSGITDTATNDSPSPVQNWNLGLKVPFADILYATSHFDPKLMIGQGGFGKVYKGTLRSGMKVAVKRSEPGHGQGLPEFQTEIMVLSKIRHRHLVSLVGYCDERSEMILVYEFMEKGTLRSHLYNDGSEESSSRFELSWSQRLEICLGAAKGLQYLHTCLEGGIIHRDVKSTNILLDEHQVAKVADFGLSRLGPQDQTHVSTDVKGSFGYLDPEYFKFLQLTQKSDVYSFGVVLLEVLCARPAISNLVPRDQVNLAEWGIFWQKKGKIEKIVDPSLVGEINSDSLRKFGEIAEKCLRDNGVDRPSMQDVLWDLEYALQLQQIVRLREPHEDSTTDASWNLPMPVVQRLPSHSISVDDDDDDVPLSRHDFLDTSLTSESQVFSQLRIDDAR